MVNIFVHDLQYLLSKDLRSDRPKVTLLRYETVRPKEHGSEKTVKLSKANSGEEPTEAIIPRLDEGRRNPLPLGRGGCQEADDLFRGQGQYRKAEICYRKLIEEMRKTPKAHSILEEGWPLAQLEWKLSQVLLEIAKQEMKQFNYERASMMIEEALELACPEQEVLKVASTHVDELNERLLICRAELEEREKRG